MIRGRNRLPTAGRLARATLLCLGAIGTPVGSPAAQEVAGARKIGFLSVFSEADPGSLHWHRAFDGGLRKRGWVVGRNVVIAYRWARDREECRKTGRRACLPILVRELLSENVELIVVHGGLPAQIVQQIAPSLPVVMAEVSDAVGRGIVRNLARPEGNITGLTSLTPVIAAKRLELLKQVVPDIVRVGILWTPNAPASVFGQKQVVEAARRLGLATVSVELRRNEDLDETIRRARAAGANAFISTAGVSSTFGIKRLAELVGRAGSPSIFTNYEATKFGGLMSYSRGTEDMYRRAAAYVDAILRGAKPSDLPIEQPTQFYLTVNMKTARGLGIKLPQSILLRADEIIE